MRASLSAQPVAELGWRLLAVLGASRGSRARSFGGRIPRDDAVRQSVPVLIVADSSSIIQQCVDPYVDHMLGIPRDRDAPIECRPANRQVLQTLAYVIRRLAPLCANRQYVATALRSGLQNTGLGLRNPPALRLSRRLHRSRWLARYIFCPVDGTKCSAAGVLEP